MKAYLRIFTAALVLMALLLSTSCALFPDPTPAPDPGADKDPNPIPTDPTLPYDTAVVINEICASNEGSYTASDGKLYDWIELYNPSTERQNLKGWMFSDDPSDPAKFYFSQNVYLDPGEYLILVAVGKNGPQNLDEFCLPFSLSEDGDTVVMTNPHGEVYYTLDYPALNNKTDEITYGRILDGEDEWAELNPSAVASNEGNVRTLATSLIKFSHESGMYEDAFDLTIDIPTGYKVFYTIDCSDPLTSSTAKRWNRSNSLTVYDPSKDPDKYSGIKVCDGSMYIPIDPVDKCFIIRAFVEDYDGHRSRTITKCYFIGFGEKDGYTDIPIISLTADPHDLYDKEEGLFVSDYWGYDSSVNRFEIPCNFTYIDENGNYLFNQTVGIRIRGTSTRGLQQKNLNIFARSSYDGNSSFVDPLFDGVKTTKSVVLRADGMSGLGIGQGFLQDLVADRNISTQKNYPVAVFLDGEYYGIYNLYERFDDDYVEEYFGVNDKDVWIAKKGGAKSAIDANCPEAEADYLNLMHFICNYNTLSNFADPKTYEKLCQWVDVESLVDLLAVQLYIGNEDFSIAQNIAAWRSATIDPTNPYADGRWRFVLYDLDYTLDCSANGVHYDYKYDPFTQSQPWAGGGFMNWAFDWKPQFPFTKNLLKSTEFRDLFARTMSDLAYGNFEPTRCVDMMMEAYERLLPNMVNYVKRYHDWYRYSDAKMPDEFYDKILPDMVYLQHRAEYILKHMASAFDILDEECEITLKLVGADDVYLGLNSTTIYVKENKRGVTLTYYVDGFALTAPEIDGFTFIGWTIESGYIVEGDEHSPTIVVEAGGGATITANYQENS